MAFLMVVQYEVQNEPSPPSDVDWLNWVVVNTQPATIAHGEELTDQQKLDFIADFDPDMFDWWSGALMNRAYIATMRGIAADSSIEYEYEAPLHGVRFFEDEIYGDNGPGVKEDGGAPVDSFGDTQMTHLAPKWHETVKAGQMRLSLHGDMVCQDNLIHGLHYNYGQFDDWSNSRFVSYMTNNFSSAELTQMGFSMPFSIRYHVGVKRNAGYTNEMLIEEPIVHEFVRFYYMYLIDTVADLAEEIHRMPSQLTPEETAFYGNLGSMTMLRTPGLAYSEHVDMVWIERIQNDQPCFTSQIQARSSLMYKIGSSAGHFEKAVCTYLAPPETATKRLGNAVTAAEAYANGGLIVLASHFQSAGGKEGALYKAHMHHARFANAHRELFIDRAGVADVAIVNSVPSLFWRWFSSLEVNRPHMQEMEAAARLLEDHHVPYKIIMFGHPDIYGDSDHLAQLNEYKTVVLPNIDCISDVQVNAVEQWVRAGGKLVLWSEVGTRDEELNTRAQNAFDDLVADPGAGQVVLASGADTTNYINKVPGAEAILAALFDQPNPLLETDLPPTVWANVWQHGAGPMTTVQMVNYDIDMASDSVAEVSNFTVKARIPNGVVFSQATYYHTDYLATDVGAIPAPQILPLQITNGYAEVTVPHLGVFGVLSFSASNEQDARGTAAEVRKWYERLKMALRMPGWQGDAATSNLLDSTEFYLSGIQGDVQVADFGVLVGSGQTLATDLEAAVEEITLQVPQDRYDRLAQTLAANALHKFDFGSDGNSPSGWQPVGVDTNYTAQLGYGWVQKNPLSAVVYSAPHPQDMNLHFPFDDLALATNCTLVGGMISKGIELSGSTSTIESANGLLDPENSSFTIAGWLKTGGTVDTSVQYFVSKGNRSNSESGWAILETNGRLMFRFNDGHLPPGIYTTQDFLGTNQWYHFTFVIDRVSHEVTGYVNGLPISGIGSSPSQSIPSNAFFASSDPMKIGQAGDSNYYPGYVVDDFRIWRRALDATEISGLYETASTPYGYSDTMHGSYIRSSNPLDYIAPVQNAHYPAVLPPVNEAEFRVDLPNGDYIVTAVVGDRDEFYNAHRVGTTYIDAEGVPVAYGERLNSGRYQNRVFPVTVSDGHLDLRLWGRNVGPLYQNNCDWMINGLLIQQTNQTLTDQAALNLIAMEDHAASVIREWRTIGPFEDPDWLGFEKNFGPEQSTDTNTVYNTGSTQVVWQVIAPLIGDAPYVSFNEMLGGISTNGACGFAMALVQCAGETDAFLNVSTTQFGEAYLNGEKVLTDNLPAGLLSREQRVAIKLNNGLNTIVVKTLNHWGDEWALWASLTDVEGKPLQNIEAQ